MAKTLKEKTAKGLFWGGLSSGVMQLLNLIFGIFLSRLLSPSDYGMVGMLTIFIAVAGIFTEGGFISAIVNKKIDRDEDYNALFWFNLILGISFYLLLFFCAPLIASFYRKPELISLSRFLFIGFLISSCSAAPSAYFTRHLMVKERGKISIIGVVFSGIIGVFCAFHGWGYWGLALQYILYSSTNALLLWVISPWKPSFSINFRPLKEMFSFSSKIVFTNIFQQINNNIFSVLLGRFYAVQQVGYYTQGNKWTNMGSGTVIGMITSVAQPVLHESSEDKERIRNVFRKLLRFTAFVSFPCMFGLALVAKEVIVITITAKWIPSSSVMQILCIWAAFMPIVTLYSSLMNSINRPNVYMWNTMGLGLLQLICVFCSYPYGLTVMLYVFVVVNVLWLFVWHYYAWKCIALPLWDVIKDISPYIILSVVAIFISSIVSHLISHNLFILLACKIIIAAAIYVFAVWRLHSVVFRESIQYLFKR
jgi:lipopolysaccharide exporter